MAKKTIEDLINKLSEFERQLKSTMPSVSREMAGTVLSYTLAGLRKNGIPGNPRYSSKAGVPAYLYRGKNRDYPKLINAGGRAFIEKKIKELEDARKVKKAGFKGYKAFGSSTAGLVNWKQIRKSQGLQTSNVDLTYSGRMFQSTGITGSKTRGTNYITMIAGMDKETRDKLKHNFARYGPFLAPSPKALEFARIGAKNRIETLFKKIITI